MPKYLWLHHLAMQENGSGEPPVDSGPSGKSGAEKLPEDRLEPQPQVRSVDRCQECGVKLGAGYLCDECDTVTFEDE
jgi:hypothetical protein